MSDPINPNTDLTEGDVIDVAIRGARFVGARNGNEMVYTTEVGGKPVEHTLHFGQGWPGHTVERVAPPAYPPRAGDIWRTWWRGPVVDRNGRAVGTRLVPQDWVARLVGDDESAPEIRLYQINGECGGDGDDPHKVAKQSARMPELVHRFMHTAHDLNDVEVTEYTVDGTGPMFAADLTKDRWIVLDGEMRLIAAEPRIFGGNVAVELATRYPNHSNRTERRVFPMDMRLLAVIGQVAPIDGDEEVPL